MRGKPTREELEKKLRELEKRADASLQLEEALRECREQRNLLTEQTLLSVLIIQDGSVVFANRAYSELVGRPLEEILKWKLEDTIRFVHPDDREFVVDQGSRKMRGEADEAVVNYQYRGVDGKGEDGWVEQYSQTVMYKGRTADMISMINITERKRAEEERARLEEQLRRSQKMEAIGTLAGGIAHDFNNILGIIVGNTDLALNYLPAGSPVRTNLQEVRKASRRAGDMVDRILSFSRKAEEERKPVRIDPIVRASLDLLCSSLPATIEIRENYEAPSDTVLADPAQIHQVLINLGTNAVHAMREKGGVLEVSLRNAEVDRKSGDPPQQEIAPGEYVVLTLRDEGQGMEPKILERIFDPYFTTKGVGEGTGMGLSVVHGIVKNHGGAVFVESAPGKGTTFEVFLPLCRRPAEPESEIHAPLPGGGERILFVDDDATLAELGRQMLQHLGYGVTLKTSSTEALETFRAQPDRFDLVVTDMTMPGMTGVDLSRELLRLRPDIRIILCTGYSDLVTEDKARQMGLKAFLMKPLAMRELAQTVRRVLDQDGKERRPARARILLVEDDEQMRRTLRRILEDANHEVVEASDGRVAARLYREDPTDLIVTDLIMPHKEGLELITELRRDFAGVKIIAISGGGRLGPDEYLPIARKLGALSTLAKPFDREEILKAVEDVLKGDRPLRGS